MSAEALQACMDRHLKHAAMVYRLDDELGTHHGLSWADFVLLTVLDAAAGLRSAFNVPQIGPTTGSVGDRAPRRGHPGGKKGV